MSLGPFVAPHRDVDALLAKKLAYSGKHLNAIIGSLSPYNQNHYQNS